MKYIKLFEIFDKEEYDRKISQFTLLLIAKTINAFIDDNDIEGLKKFIKEYNVKDVYDLSYEDKKLIQWAAQNVCAHPEYGMEMIDYLWNLGCDVNPILPEDMELMPTFGQRNSRIQLNWKLLDHLIDKGYNINVNFDEDEEIKLFFDYLESAEDTEYEKDAIDTMLVILNLNREPENIKVIKSMDLNTNLIKKLTKRHKNLYRSNNVGLWDLKTNEIFKYLPVDVKKELKTFVVEWIKERDIINKINQLDIDWFSEVEFNLFDVWENMLSYDSYNDTNNIYHAIDEYLKNEYPTSNSRNSLFDILQELYKEYKIKNKLYNRLIDILNEDPNLYDEYKEDIEKQIKLPNYLNRSHNTGLWDLKTNKEE
jgi:hypothetical protein